MENYNRNEVFQKRNILAINTFNERQITATSSTIQAINILVDLDQISPPSLFTRLITSGHALLQCGPEHTSRNTTLSSVSDTFKYQ